MEKNHKIIIVGLVIVIIALVVVLATMIQAPTKENVKLTIENKKTIEKGNNIKIKLTDMNGTPIKGQTVNISITDKKGTTDYHSVVTNGNGVGKLKVDKSPGKYTVECSYGGNENYTGNNDTQKLKIKEKPKTELISENSQSEASSTSTEPDPSEDDPYAGMYQEYLDENGDTVKQFNWGDGSVELCYADGHSEMIRPDGSVETL